MNWSFIGFGLVLCGGREMYVPEIFHLNLMSILLIEFS